MIYKIFSKIRRTLFPTSFDKAVALWFENEGDNTLRLEYSLNEHSVVFDLGGYRGDWASDIYSRYRSRIYVFEPVRSFFISIDNRFIDNSSVSVFCFGLGAIDKELKIFVSDDSSNSFSKSGSEEIVEIKSVLGFIDSENIEIIDLMKINIEGGEYELLDCLIDSGAINRVNNLQIQFHDFVPDAKSNMLRIQEQLAKTHYVTYQYAPFVWENWRLKGL